jgi:hypothetical protein
VNQSSSATPAESAENLGKGLSDMIAALRLAGKRVIVVKDSPLFAFDPVRRLRRSMIPVRAIMAHVLLPGTDSSGSAPQSEIQSHDHDIASAIVQKAAGTSATIFDLQQNLCNEQTCAFFADDELLYLDSQHLTVPGALRALKGLPLSVAHGVGNPAITSTM